MFDLIEKFSIYQAKNIDHQEMTHSFILPFMQRLNWREENIEKSKIKTEEISLYNLKIAEEAFFMLAVVPFDNKKNNFDKYTQKVLSLGYNTKIDWVVMSNFYNTAVYNNRWQENSKDYKFKPYKTFNYKDYIGSGVRIIDKEIIESGDFTEATNRDKPKKIIAPIDDFMLNRLLSFRGEVFKDLAKATIDNSKKDELIFNLYSAIFLARILEDKSSKFKKLCNIPETKNIKNNLWEIISKLPYSKVQKEDLEMFSDNIIISLIRNFYYKNLIYEINFSLINEDILGSLYEKYLGLFPKIKSSEQTSLLNNFSSDEVIYEGKQKYQGIYYTPNYISKFITNLALDKWIEKNSYAKNDIKIADISCGSGTFLVNAINKIVKDNYYKRYSSYKDFLLGSIFGFDIDPRAIETAKLNILQNTIIEELNGIGSYNLDNNLVVKDSLLDNIDRNFDIGIGNPPYVSSSPENLHNKELKEKYNDVIFGNYNTYQLFLKKSIELLNDGGILGYIVPRTLLNQKSASKLRDFIKENMQIELIVDLTDQKVFKSASIYTLILILRKVDKKYIDNSNVKVLKVNNIQENFESLQIKLSLEDKRKTRNEEVFNVDIESQKDEWYLISKSEENIFNIIKKQRFTLSNIANISQGVITGLNEFYIVDILNETDNTCIIRNSLDCKNYDIEKIFVKKIISSKDIAPFHIKYHNKGLVFPYIKNDKLPIKEIKSEYPLLYKYLASQKDRLSKRKSLKEKSNWHVYVREQSFGMEIKKIVSPYNSFNASFALDENGEYFMSAGVAGGNYIILKSEYSKYYLAVVGILNSRLFDWYVQNNSDVLGGKYYSYEPKYIREFPMKLNNKSMIRKIEQVVAELNKKENEIILELDKKIIEYKRNIETLNKLVYELYNITPEMISDIENSFDLKRRKC